jgi:hypothetical protein
MIDLYTCRHLLKVQDKDGIVLLKKLKSVVARFWWGGDEKKRKIHWKKWEDIAISKTEGGWGP